VQAHLSCLLLLWLCARCKHPRDKCLLGALHVQAQRIHLRDKLSLSKGCCVSVIARWCTYIKCTTQDSVVVMHLTSQCPSSAARGRALLSLRKEVLFAVCRKLERDGVAQQATAKRMRWHGTCERRQTVSVRYARIMFMVYAKCVSYQTVIHSGVPCSNPA